VRRVFVEARTCKARPIWIVLSSRITTLEDGSTIIEGAIEDVTDLHRAQTDLERAYMQFAHAVDAAPIPIMLHRADDRIEAVNQVWLKLTGYQREELNTIDDWTRLAYGDRQKDVLQVISRLRQAEAPSEEGEFTIRCKDGSMRIWSFRSAPLETEINSTRLLISTAIDVTEARASEARTRQAEAVIDSANEGITITGPDRNIERVNPAFTRITGYAEPEVLGKNPRILSSGRQDASFYRVMWDSIDRRGHWQGEIWNRRKNGEIYPEWLSISAVLNPDGELVNYAAVFTDLTEIKELRVSTRFPAAQGWADRTRQPHQDGAEHRQRDCIDRINRTAGRGSGLRSGPLPAHQRKPELPGRRSGTLANRPATGEAGDQAPANRPHRRRSIRTVAAFD